MVAGLTFPFYSEARITFMPTYKYDNGTDNYDTSCVATRYNVQVLSTDTPKGKGAHTRMVRPYFTKRE
jgi:hypothetical protein